jgi:hypothetical protein
MSSRNPLVADSPDDLDPNWEAELERRMRDVGKGGGYKGQKGGRKGRDFKGDEKGRDWKGGEKGHPQPKGKGKGKGKGLGSKSRESSQGSKGGKPGGGGWGAKGAAGYAAAWGGWGAKGGNAAATFAHPEVDIDEGTWTLIAFGIIMVLIGAFMMTALFRRSAARFLRKLASLIDPVGEAVGRALHGFPAVAGAMPQRRRPEDETSSIGTQTDTAAPDLNVGARAVHKLYWLEKMTVYELKTHCRDEGLAVTGTKADLIWRIEHHRAANFRPCGGDASAI